MHYRISFYFSNVYLNTFCFALQGVAQVFCEIKPVIIFGTPRKIYKSTGLQVSKVSELQIMFLSDCPAF